MHLVKQDGQVIILDSFNLTSLTSQFMRIQVLFENPSSISSDFSNPDYLSVRFIDECALVTVDRSCFSKDLTILHEVPQQVSLDEFHSIQSTNTAVQASMTVDMSSISLTNLLIGGSLKFIWGMINLLQFVIFFTEWGVKFPVNASNFVEKLRFFALGEFLPKKEILGLFTGAEE